jgi:caffeoyl-CoA O-methyltransferase
VARDDDRWFPEAADHEWIESLGRPIHPVLLAMETAAAPEGIPILDRSAGRVLAALASDRRRIVEIGTAIGYSTLWMALAQPPEGTIVAVDPKTEWTDRARASWREAGIADERITLVTAKALEALAADDPRLRGPFDLAFIDALKPEYGAYLDALVPRLDRGAVVLADNVLWSGRASGGRPSEAGDSSVEALRSFSAGVLADRRFTGTILPVGDGLLLATYVGPAR